MSARWLELAKECGIGAISSPAILGCPCKQCEDERAKLESFYAKARAEALEEAANVCDKRARELDYMKFHEAAQDAKDCKFAILAQLEPSKL